MAWRDHLSGGNVREVIKISLPLILASAGHTLNLFADRVMLSRYSQDAVGASFPAGLTAFCLSCFFVGTIGYANTFVAQYFGATNYRRVGTAVWQGIFMSLFGGALLACGWFWARPLFALFQHTAEIERQEIIYYKILAIGTVLPLLMGALSAFWSGRGRMTMIMLVNFLVTGINIPCNYLLIYGKTLTLPLFGEVTFPEMGIAGAAWGTNIAGAVGLLFLAAFFFLSKKNRETYQTCTNVWDWALFKRMLLYGSPNGMQLFLDLASFNVFAVILGQINPDVQAAASIAFAINSLAFMPMIGIGMTVSVLVGQAIGAGELDHAERSVKSARIVVLVYMAAMGLLFALRPEWVLAPFNSEDAPLSPAAYDYARNFLYFIAAYVLFDGLFIIYSNAIKGAGDTKFAMWAHAAIAWLVFAIPCILYHHFVGEVWGMWCLSVFGVICCGMTFYWRYRGGKWKKMRVIE